eukprot:TRINITY_DN67868_c4_g1_i13.p2 TRINITY_DN67868_c4_g1~~TRINITY_DN67868_c4_g1_i13.p2  ORF type:complete len:138 (-),score=15.62 TRINITY_DN67868_c4_g1_i13:359-772(-)
MRCATAAPLRAWLLPLLLQTVGQQGVPVGRWGLAVGPDKSPCKEKQSALTLKTVGRKLQVLRGHNFNICESGLVAGLAWIPLSAAGQEKSEREKAEREAESDTITAQVTVRSGGTSPGATDRTPFIASPQAKGLQIV